MATEINLPQVNSRGIFVLNSPFNNYVDPNTIYECKEVRKFDELINNKVNIYKQYYPSSISEETYKQHLRNGASLVTLRSDSGRVVHIPSPYIRSFPSGIGVPYRNIILGVRIGVIPDGEDLSVLKTKIIEVVRDTIGVAPTCQEVVASEVAILSYPDDAQLRAARQALVTDPTSITSKARALELENTELRNKVVLLEQYIIDNTP